MSLYVERVTHDLTGEQSTLIYKALDRYARDMPDGPTRRKIDELCRTISEDQRAVFLGDRAMRKLAETPEGEKVAAACDAHRAERAA